GHLDARERAGVPADRGGGAGMSAPRGRARASGAHRLRALLLLGLGALVGIAAAWLPHATAAANDPRLIHSERSLYRDVLVYQDDEQHTRCSSSWYTSTSRS